MHFYHLRSKVLESSPQVPAKIPTPSIHQPVTIIYMAQSCIAIATEHEGKEPLASRLPTSVEVLPEIPPLLLSQHAQPEELEPETVVSEHGKAKSEGSSRPPESSKQEQVNDPARRAASIKSGAVAKEIGKELDQKQREFFHVTPMTKQIEPPLEVSWLSMSV